jgi:hypothetical protein
VPNRAFVFGVDDFHVRLAFAVKPNQTEAAWLKKPLERLEQAEFDEFKVPNRSQACELVKKSRR